ncbi:glycosyltransferase [Pseudomonas sp. F1_0610]|uniref:glycosyltransferase family 2 protein n=1 Tax=Pseudomonas sp. F1_0610 TaxID=3114284 RepID=UPI0039C1131C
MNERPLVSIVVPCYNHENFVQETIQSIIDQDYKNIELIIIDDGSKDNSVSMIQKLVPACEARFVRFEFRHRQNKGLCATLNEGLAWSRGQYFSPSASDDILEFDKISIQVNILNKEHTEDIAGVFTGISIINESKEIIKIRGANKVIGFREAFLRSALMPGQAFMAKRSILNEVSGYNENFKIEDLDLFLRICSAGYFLVSINKPLVYYRQHENNLSSNFNIMLDAVKNILAQYSNNPLYAKALSNSIMIEAHGVQRSSKRKSWYVMFDAIKTYPLNIFSKSFVWYFIKFLK